MKYTQVKEVINDLGREKLEELIEEYGIDVVEGYVNEGYSLSDFEEAYQGKYDNDEDFVYQLCNDLYDLNEHKGEFHPFNYIDWERVTNDVMMDYFEVEGHYFRQL
mgnify:CR=1 FL=1